VGIRPFGHDWGMLQPIIEAPDPGGGHGNEEGHCIDVGRFRLFVREQGDGHPLLMIMGLGGNTEMWGPAERVLARGSRTIVFDAPGMGRSRPSPVPLPLPMVAGLLGRLLDQLGHDRVDVVGYSLGGVMAQQLAHSAPERVRRLALVGTSCGWGGAPPDLASLALITTPLRYLSPAVYKATSHLLDGGDRFRDPELKRAQARARNSHPPTWIGYAQQFLQGSTWSSLHWCWSLSMPTLVIVGERDRLVPPANGLLLAHGLPKARLHRLEGEGHLMLFDPRSAALPLLSDFFSSPDAEASAAWRKGECVDDRARVDAALEACPGAQPIKTFSRAYRALIRTPVVRGLFGG
jgi:pimeloyl-ACP methyl ester carboxylesterase